MSKTDDELLAEMEAQELQAKADADKALQDQEAAEAAEEAKVAAAAEAAKAEEGKTKAAKKAPVLKGKQSLRTTGGGVMVHPFQPKVTFDSEGSKLVELDDWMRMQIDAGKLAVAVED